MLGDFIKTYWAEFGDAFLVGCWKHAGDFRGGIIEVEVGGISICENMARRSGNLQFDLLGGTFRSRCMLSILWGHALSNARRNCISFQGIRLFNRIHPCDWKFIKVHKMTKRWDFEVRTAKCEIFGFTYVGEFGWSLGHSLFSIEYAIGNSQKCAKWQKFGFWVCGRQITAFWLYLRRVDCIWDSLILCEKLRSEIMSIFFRFWPTLYEGAFRHTVKPVIEVHL
jgi:hypothetical protein